MRMAAGRLNRRAIELLEIAVSHKDSTGAGLTSFAIAQSMNQKGRGLMSSGRLLPLLGSLVDAGLISRTKETSASGAQTWRYRVTGAAMPAVIPSSVRARPATSGLGDEIRP